MEGDKIILNTIDWDSEDIDNKFTIHSYGVDEEGNSIGLKITSIQDITPVPHNGCRPPKKRRI